jgi:hypothetical protein
MRFKSSAYLCLINSQHQHRTSLFDFHLMWEQIKQRGKSTF